MKCPVCEQRELGEFFRVDSAPVFCNVLWETRREAMSAPRAPIRLGFCPHCALVYNIAFEPELLRYAPAYENSLHFSPRFQRYAVDLARQLVERRSLYRKRIVEIGCGRGDFLALLCRLGGNQGLGFDPSFSPADPTPHPDIEIRSEPFSHLHRGHDVDFLCCRQVLEHVPDPLHFLRELRRTIAGSRADVFFEVPFAMYTLRELGIWDILYEHCSYFVGRSLTEAFGRSGFLPGRLAQTFGGQFLTLEATAAQEPVVPNETGEKVCDVAASVEAFAAAYRQKVAHWQEEIARIRDSGRRAALWGAGTKGVMFLNTLAVSDSVIPFVVDLNPRKHGKFIPGVGQRVAPPEALRAHPVEFVIAMNPNYLCEIQDMLVRMGSDAQVISA